MASLQDLLEEATCSICLECFQDPVLIPECGHNFCRGCLSRSWGTSESEASCPQCRQTFAPRSVFPNRQLAQVLEVARRCGGPWGEEVGSFCSKHREPLKLFCREHETLICLVCDRSNEHRGHSVIPAEEAFQEYQDHIEKVKKNIVAQFRELQLWLEGQEKLLLSEMEEAEKDIMARKEKGHWKHLEEVKNVILDPETAHPDYLEISKDRKSARGLKPVKEINAVPNCNRFESNPYVLGCQKFSTGRHFWEVIVGDKTGWRVGVANKPLNLTDVDEQTSHWQIGECGGKYKAICPSGCSDLVLTERPTRIRISLNCEEGQVAFFDARTAALLHTFSDASLVGETLLPCFYLCEAQRASPDLEEKKRHFIFSYLLPAEEAAMAAGASLQDLLEEASCSICLDFFQDPVLIPECGHNYCRGCLTRSWGTSESEASSCPQCRQIFAPRSVLPNRQLARVAEEARRCSRHPEEEGGSFCPKHREPLKLFCKDHETLICVVCDRSKEHSCHWVIPAEEAFQEYQDIIKKVKRYVVAEFRELQLWLEGQEKLILSEMEESGEGHYGKKGEGFGQAHGGTDIGSILKKYQAKETYENPVDLLGDPKWTIWDYVDIPGLLKNAMKKLRENVILDPDTAHPDWLEISEDRKSVKGLKAVKEINASPNCKRFKKNPYVLGCQEFSTGRHFWEVIVGDTTGWGVGVANKPLNLTDVDAQTRHWQIGKWYGKYMAISPSERFDLILTEEPTTIRICLNCEEGQVAFFDAWTTALLHTFSDASLVGETLLPSFFLCEGACMTLPSKKG
ncbi:hypothetical protein E2320_014553 [Naja naja]|nr:hypothetical protein E2320_014553 [Naja naja]